LIGGVVQEVFKEIESLKDNVPKDVYNASFESALLGIENNQCDFQKDIVLEKIKV
jgi:hypothetical protein